MADASAKRLGFESAAELHRMVAAVDLTSPGKLLAFKAWQEVDGTKAGLARLPVRNRKEATGG